MTLGSPLRLLALTIALLNGVLLTPSSQAQDVRPERVLIEAEDLQVDGGWQPISVGEGNYFVDSVGAAHYSGGRMLRLATPSGLFSAYSDIEIPADGAYRVWTRYDFPGRDAPVPFQIQITQSGEIVFDQAYGRVDATRMWFFNLRDAPWQDLQHGVEGPVSESHDTVLHAGPARIVLLGEPSARPAADRVVDFIFLTSDLTDDFRQRGERLYPMLDEVGRAVPGRLFARVTNPVEASAPLSLEAQYTFNRAPWRSPAVQLGPRGAIRGSTPAALAPGNATPWMDLTCQDTTHPCHLHLRSPEPVSAPPIVELSSAPDSAGVLRQLALRDLASESIVTIPTYPTRQPEGIRTLSETLHPIVTFLESASPPGRLPRRFPIYASLGDNVERRLDGLDDVFTLYRRLFFLVGANAFNNLNISALSAERAAATIEGLELGRFYMYGDYRWFPTPERVEKAQRDLNAAVAEQLLRGFTLGDEIKLSDWYPRGEDGDADFRQAMQALGETPESLGASDWGSVRLDTAQPAARPRLFVRSRQFQDAYAIQQVRAGVENVRAAFGPDVLIGANFSPHPDFRPDVATFVQSFREGGLTLASHSDYWWQASEMGPESTGFIIDAFRAGLRDTGGTIQPYVMPHSPGNTSRDFMLGLWTAIIHGARSVDLFRIGPEQINTENYISSIDIDRYRAIREALHLLGPAEDTLLDGATRPTSVALVLSESTDRWEAVTPAQGSGIPPSTRLTSQASNTERKGLWQALRHAHVPVDMLTEDDLATDVVDRYRVIYLAGPQLSTGAAEGLVSWMERGGTLVSVAGAGTMDEFASPSSTLSAAQGITERALYAPETFLRPRVEVPRLPSLGPIYLTAGPSGSFDAVAWRESLKADEGTEVLATFDDGTPAITRAAMGRGRAITIGTLIGTAYLRSGVDQPAPLPDRGPFMHRALTSYSAVIRDVITRWSTGGVPSQPRVSDPLVEVGLVETPEQIVALVANHGAGATTLEMTIPDAGNVSAVSSVRLGEIPFTVRDDALLLQMPLDIIDTLIVDRQT